MNLRKALLGSVSLGAMHRGVGAIDQVRQLNIVMALGRLLGVLKPGRRR